MHAAGGPVVPSPVWGFAGIVVGGAVALWQSQRISRDDRRKASGSVDSSDAKVVFDAQQAALVMSEQMRHDLRDQVERCQVELQKLKDAHEHYESQLRKQAEVNADVIAGYKKRVEALGTELGVIAKQLSDEREK